MKYKFIKTAFIAVLAIAIYGCDTNTPSNPDSGSNGSNNTENTETAKGFTVEDGRQVIFSPGNLQYQARTKTWRFAENQYDYIGEANKNISSIAYDGWIDLFGWGTGSNPTERSGVSKDYSTFTDWGVNKIGDYPANTWRTLTAAEWEYMITYRPNAPKLFGLAAVKGIGGVVLLPDEWVCPEGLEFNPGNADNYTNNLYSSAQWKQMEAAGAIFLPAAGYRESVGGIYFYQNYAYYWTSTVSTKVNEFVYAGSSYIYYYAYCFDKAKIHDAVSRECGCSVRLVRDL